MGGTEAADEVPEGPINVKAGFAHDEGESVCVCARSKLVCEDTGTDCSSVTRLSSAVWLPWERVQLN